MDTPSVNKKILNEFRPQTDCFSRMYIRVFLNAELHPVGRSLSRGVMVR